MKMKFLPRDKVNFFHHINKVYPTKNVVDSKCRIFMSLFSDSKGYLVLKSGNIPALNDICDVQLALYRKDTMLFLKLRFVTKDESNSFYSLLPINALKDAVSHPRYPSSEDGELMQLEIHFLDYLNNDILRKVIRLYINDLDFTQRLVDEYLHQASSDWDLPTMDIDLNAFLSTPYKRIGKYLIAESDCSIEKMEPARREAALNNVPSVYDIVEE